MWFRIFVDISYNFIILKHYSDRSYIFLSSIITFTFIMEIIMNIEIWESYLRVQTMSIWAFSS